MRRSYKKFKLIKLSINMKLILLRKGRMMDTAPTPDEHPNHDHMFIARTCFRELDISDGQHAGSRPNIGLDFADDGLECGAHGGSERRRGPWVLHDNEGTQVITQRLLQPLFCLCEDTRFDAIAPILPLARTVA